MKATKVRWLSFFFVLFVFVLTRDAGADKLTMTDGSKVKGIVKSEQGNDIILQTRTDFKYYAKEQIETMNIWGGWRNGLMEKNWAVQSFFAGLTEALRGGPGGIGKFFKPYNDKLLSAVSKNAVHKKLLQIEAYKNFRRENVIGFSLAIYCVFLLLLAVAIKLIKEGVLVILSFFGINTEK